MLSAAHAFHLLDSRRIALKPLRTKFKPDRIEFFPLAGFCYSSHLSFLRKSCAGRRITKHMSSCIFITELDHRRMIDEHPLPAKRPRTSVNTGEHRNTAAQPRFSQQKYSVAKRTAIDGSDNLQNCRSGTSLKTSAVFSLEVR